jgi:hypothetical protein
MSIRRWVFTQMAVAWVGASLPAQSPTYSVGFRVVHEHDFSRAVAPRRDFAGTRLTGEIAYPMQILVWYPARASSAQRRVTIADYLTLIATRDAQRPITDADRTSARAALGDYARYGLRREVSDADVARESDRATSAVHDAPPVAGRFPVVLAATDGEPHSGISLFETLASRGYVVVATARPSWLAALQGSNPARAIDTRIRDLEYLVAFARRYPNVDDTRVALAGFNFDGMVALLTQMKNMRADAVVSVGGWEGMRLGAETVRSSMHFDPLRMRVPYFVALPDDANVPPVLAHDASVFDALDYSARERVVLRDVGGTALGSTGALYREAPESRRASVVAGRVVAFLDSSLVGRRAPQVASADSFMKSDVRRAGLHPVPDAVELERLVMSPGGSQRLTQIYRDARRENPRLTLFSAGTIALFASRLERQGRSEEANALRALGAASCAGAMSSWVGTWYISTRDGRLQGESNVAPVPGACAFLERWHGTSGGNGVSVTAFDAPSRRWMYLFVNDTGLTLTAQGSSAARDTLAWSITHFSESAGQPYEQWVWESSPTRRTIRISSDSGARWSTVATLTYHPWTSALPAVSRHNGPCHAVTGYRGLDFLIGAWDMRVASRRVGTLEVDSILDGCAIRAREQRAGGSSATHLFGFDGAANVWRALTASADSGGRAVISQVRVADGVVSSSTDDGPQSVLWSLGEGNGITLVRRADRVP